jgi:LuxR family maltose regulon positive regulatory protein
MTEFARGVRLKAGPRQRQVLALVAKGHTDSQVALELGISVATVRTYLIRLYRDNGFASRTQAAVAWLDSGEQVTTN